MPPYPQVLLLAMAGVLSVVSAVDGRWLCRADDLAAVRKRVDALEQEASLRYSGLRHGYAPRLLGSIVALNTSAVEIL
jgi:hypothetical protein